MGVLRAVGTLDTAARTRQFARTWHRCLRADARGCVNFIRKIMLRGTRRPTTRANILYYFSSVSVPADQEEDSLQELKRIAEAYKRQFSDWLAEDQGGLFNQSWLIMGGVIILLLCVGCCCITNRGDPAKELQG